MDGDVPEYGITLYCWNGYIFIDKLRRGEEEWGVGALKIFNQNRMIESVLILLQPITGINQIVNCDASPMVQDFRKFYNNFLIHFRNFLGILDNFLETI